MATIAVSTSQVDRIFAGVTARLIQTDMKIILNLKEAGSLGLAVI
ncbi:MAG: hypothetical protein V4805_04540 [Pseudomonadota bacterium]